MRDRCRALTDTLQRTGFERKTLPEIFDWLRTVNNPHMLKAESKLAFAAKLDMAACKLKHEAISS